MVVHRGGSFLGNGYHLPPSVSTWTPFEGEWRQLWGGHPTLGVVAFAFPGAGARTWAQVDVVARGTTPHWCFVEHDR